jgi:hypothetical protein
MEFHKRKLQINSTVSAVQRCRAHLAAVRLMPTAPLRMLSRNTVVGGSLWKASMARARCRCAMLPVMVLLTTMQQWQQIQNQLHTFQSQKGSMLSSTVSCVETDKQVEKQLGL